MNTTEKIPSTGPTPTRPLAGLIQHIDPTAKEALRDRGMTRPVDPLVDGFALIKLLWHEDSRPAVGYLATLRRRKILPHVRLGRRIYYSPIAVLAEFEKHRI